VAETQKTIKFDKHILSAVEYLLGLSVDLGYELFLGNMQG
jgi:hypothetical protein